MRILICGIPGIGKTHLGDRLRDRQGFTHIDMESDRFAGADRAMSDPAAFIAGLPGGNLVLTWGFSPLGMASDAITQLIASGFVPVWVDGDREMARRSFMRRENENEALEAAFYLQVSLTIATRIRHRWPWVAFDPFDSTGLRLPTPDVALINLIKASS
jgi:adenylate kinase family enzyme